MDMTHPEIRRTMENGYPDDRESRRWTGTVILQASFEVAIAEEDECYDEDLAQAHAVEVVTEALKAASQGKPSPGNKEVLRSWSDIDWVSTEPDCQ